MLGRICLEMRPWKTAFQPRDGKLSGSLLYCFGVYKPADNYIDGRLVFVRCRGIRGVRDLHNDPQVPCLSFSGIQNHSLSDSLLIGL
jgi:hypothetical protein